VAPVERADLDVDAGDTDRDGIGGEEAGSIGYVAVAKEDMVDGLGVAVWGGGGVVSGFGGYVSREGVHNLLWIWECMAGDSGARAQL